MLAHEILNLFNDQLESKDLYSQQAEAKVSSDAKADPRAMLCSEKIRVHFYFSIV